MPLPKSRKHCEMPQSNAYALGIRTFAGHALEWFLVIFLVEFCSEFRSIWQQGFYPWRVSITESRRQPGRSRWV
jgi:hypothetical protein